MLRAVVALACAFAVVTPSSSFAGAPKCRANDPGAAADAGAVQTVREQIDAACDCASFPADGKKSKHGDYVKCAKGVVKAAVDADQLRAQCKNLALYPFALSTCGYPAEPARVPCLKATKKGPACKISKCTGAKDLPCPNRDDCLAATDTNHDGQVSALDSGQCNTLDCAAITTISQTYIDNAVIACFDGCNDPNSFQECYIGCATGASAIAEPADAIRDLCETDPTVSCAALHTAALQYCATAPLPQICADQCINDPICAVRCAQSADCTAVAAEINATCAATNY